MSRGSSSSPSSPSRRSWAARSRSRDRHDRPICFKMEQRFRALKSPEIQESLRAALRAGATGIGEITYTKQGCTLDPPRDDPPWPSKDEAENHPDGHDEVIRSNNDGEAGPGAEFLVLRALGTNDEQLGQVCRHLLDLEIAVLGLAAKDPPSALYLVASSSQTQQIAEALIHEGHGLRPGNEVTGEAASTVLAAAGLSSLGKLHLSNFNSQELELFSGAWAELEETLPELGDASTDADAEKGSEAKSILQRARRLRFVSRRGLFAELHFLGESSYRVVAGTFSFEEQSADDENGENGGLGETEANSVKVSAVRKIAVDTEPMKPPDSNSPPISEMCDGELHDVTEGVSWRRITSAETPIAAAELLMEQAQGPGSKTPVFGLRAGVWIVCGDVSLQVVGPPRGEGLIGGTMCQSMDQLHQIERPQALNDELQNRYEGSTGVVSTKGCITRDRGVGAAGNAKGSLLCGATPQSEIGFKTASILYSTGLMTKGGSITLESPSGSFTQVWRIRELEDNPFDSPALRASRKVPTGPLTSPSAAAVRIASHMVPKGKGGKGKGKNKSKGRGKPPLAAPVARQALPAGGVAFSRNAPIGSVYGTPRALTVYGVRTASTPAFTTSTTRLGRNPPGRPVASLQKGMSWDRSALRGRGTDRGRGRGAPMPTAPTARNVTLTSAPNRRRSRSASRRREAQGLRGAPMTRDNTSRRRSRSHGHGGHGHGSRRSRSRSRRRGRKP